MGKGAGASLVRMCSTGILYGLDIVDIKCGSGMVYEEYDR